MSRISRGAGLWLTGRRRSEDGHLNELAALFTDILADKQLTAGEVSGARDAVIRSRALLLELWAKGDASKAVQTDLSKAGVATAYAEPLLNQN